MLLVLGLLLNPLTFFVALRFSYYPAVSTGESMAPTHDTPMVAFGDRISLRFSPPKRGDIVALHSPLDPNELLGKRVIGLPGDRLMIVRGVVFIDGARLEEPYVQIPYDRTWHSIEEFTLGPDEYWVMGDNRGSSFDSRDFGPVSRSAFRAIDTNAVVWPVSSATISGIAAVGGLLAIVVTASLVSGRAARRLSGELAPHGAKQLGWFLWVFGCWVAARRARTAARTPGGEVWRVPGRRPLPPPPGIDEAPIPTDVPVATVIVAPKLGRWHYAPLWAVLGALVIPIPDVMFTFGATLSFVWLAWYEPNARSQVRNFAEIAMICAPLGLASWLLNARLGIGGGILMFATLIVVALLIWRVRARRTLARFHELSATGAKLTGFTLLTREFRQGDADRQP